MGPEDRRACELVGWPKTHPANIWPEGACRERRPRPGAGSRPCLGATIAGMLDHEEKFLFKEEILHLSNAVAEPGMLDNVEDLLTDVITSPRFDSRCSPSSAASR